MKLLLLFGIGVLSSAVSGEYICPHCCFCFGDGWVSCSSCELISVPPNIPINATYLSFAYNSITSVKDSDISYLFNLTSFDITANGIDENGIASTAFKDMKHLTQVSLTQNNFRVIPDYLPHGLTYLQLDSNRIEQIGDVLNALYSKIQTLNLYGNSIHSISDGEFYNCRELIDLSLGNNSITTIGADVFSENSQLKQVDLRNNDIDTIHPDAFRNTNELTMLLLDNNRIRTDTVNNLFLDNLRQIRNFSLSGNPITEVPTNMPKNAINIVLSNTLISVIPAGAFKGYDNLQWLYLNDMKLLHIEPGAFLGLDNLGTLAITTSVLSPGVISPGMFDGLTNIRTLILTNASIGAIEAGAFDNIAPQQIFLMFNKISTLDQLTFAKIPQGMAILNDNPFWCDCHLRWLKVATENRGNFFFGDPYSMECAGPDSVRGASFSDLSADDFLCC